MSDGKRKVLVFGSGLFEQELLRSVVPRYSVLVVDMNEAMLNALRKEIPGIRCIAGDASSVLTWKKFNAPTFSHVLSAIRDVDVNIEICRIVRETYQLDIPITLMAIAAKNEPRFYKYNVSLLNPVGIGINAVLNKLEKNYTKAGDLGLKKGEFIEVPILSRSHLVGKTLNMLRPTKWHIAGLYRDNQMLIPRGDTQIRLKDRVVLFGDPVIIENIANRLLRGNPQFPLQFGTRIAFPLLGRLKNPAGELRYIHEIIRTQKLIGYPLSKKDLFADYSGRRPEFETADPIRYLEKLFDNQEQVGLFYLPFSGFSFLQKRKLAQVLRLAVKPVFLSRDSYPYQKIVVSLNCPEPATALELGIDLSRLFKIPLEALLAVMPGELRSAEENEQVRERKNLIADFENIHKMKIHFSLLEGNPVRATVSYLKQNPKSFAALVYNNTRASSFFSPHVQLLIARTAAVSTMLIPVEASYES